MAKGAGGRKKAKVAGLQAQLAEVYTPGIPIDDPRLFSGREELLADLSVDLAVTGVHFVLYGERGIGKTSLWQVLLKDRRYKGHSASKADDFVSIFLRVLEDLGEQFTESDRRRLTGASASVGADKVASIGVNEGVESSETPVARRKLDLNLVLDRVARRANDIDAIVIDEFQNISAAVVQTQIIEVVKGFSDRKLAVKIIFVGVADSDDELLSSPEYAQYKDRHFRARFVSRMTDAEIRDILDFEKDGLASVSTTT